MSGEAQSRVRDALRAYEIAESVYHKFQGERDALEARYRALIDRWWGEYEAGNLGPTERQAVEKELRAIGSKIVESSQPWQDAQVALVTAQEEIRAVLRGANSAPRLDS